MRVRANPPAVDTSLLHPPSDRGRPRVAAVGRPLPIQAGKTLALYASLGKPRVVGLLLFATATTYVVAGSGAVVVARLGLLLAAGGLSAIGASMVNNYLERDSDVLMLRTRHRLLASRRMVNPRPVIWIGLGLVVAGTVLGFAMNVSVGLAIGLGAVAYVLLYTMLLKRRTHWSVVIGGASGSCAVLAGWFAAASPSMAAVLLAGLLFVWQSAHFWPLALARSSDYRHAGIPMLPHVVGTSRAGNWTFVASVATVAVSLALAPTANLGALYLSGAIAAGVLWLSMAIRLVTNPTPVAAWGAFKASGIYLAAIFLFMLLDVVLIT